MATLTTPITYWEVGSGVALGSGVRLGVGVRVGALVSVGVLVSVEVALGCGVAVALGKGVGVGAGAAQALNRMAKTASGRSRAWGLGMALIIAAEKWLLLWEGKKCSYATAKLKACSEQSEWEEPFILKLLEILRFSVGLRPHTPLGELPFPQTPWQGVCAFCELFL